MNLELHDFFNDQEVWCLQISFVSLESLFISLIISMGMFMVLIVTNDVIF